ncbi:MAG: hypothetical protein ACXVEF_07510 [Polyangiales bacterium]
MHALTHDPRRSGNSPSHELRSERVHRRACLLTLFAAGCDMPARGQLAPSPSPSAAPVPYAELRARMEREREKLARAPDARDVVVEKARNALRNGIVDTLFPAWMGTRWAFHGTTEQPHGAEGIACGYFVATILQHAGLKLESRRRFGQSTALRIAKALVPAGPSHHRIFSVPAAVLEQKMLSFGDGLYVIGLDVHVGFVSVRGSAVRVVHASYTGTRRVVDEPIVASEVIERSRDAGYFVTSLFGDDTLVTAWLQNTTIAAPT